MKSLVYSIIFSFLFSLPLLAQEGIGTNAPNPQSALHVDGVNQGVLFPQVSLTASQTFLGGVTATATHTGMLVYNTNTATNTGLSGTGYYFWNTSYWSKFLGETDLVITDSDKDTKIQVEKGADDDTIRFDTAGTERAVITATGSVGMGTASPTASAKLQVESTTQGFLPPRMTETQMNAIASPAEGIMVYCTDCSYGKGLYTYNGFGFAGSSVALLNDELYSSTGKIWLDKNLGAAQVAESSTDASAYGYYYQWGRGTDGHQSGTSLAITTRSSSSSPGHGSFIRGYNDWLFTSDDTLWQGINGTNNPCPSGFRIPTETEWDNEIQTFSPDNSVGAFKSLRLPLGGFRNVLGGGNAVPGNVGILGIYWSSTVAGATGARRLAISTNAVMDTNGRGYGFSVRCIKD